MNDDGYQPTGHVYYCYATDGALLYVGSTRDVNSRVYMHLGYYGSPWMPRYCTRIDVGPAMPLAEARATEKREITRLCPVFNKHHNPNPTAWTPVWRPDGPSMRPPEIVWLDSLPQRPVILADDLRAWVAARPTERQTA